MGNCIYFCDKHRGLTYKNSEHIISSAIGGRRTLPKGYVSNQANNFLSKYELACMRYSPLFIERAKLGPGKRGSFNINKIDDPDILALEPIKRNSSQYTCPLGFLFLDKAYIIPQFIVIFDNNLQDYNVVYLKIDCPNFTNVAGCDWNSQIQKLLLSDKKNYKKVPIPYDTKQYFSCIGYYKKKWFFCSTLPNASIDKTLHQILQREPLSQLMEEHLGFSLSTPTFRYLREFQLENFAVTFLHAKNCFNALAFFKGNEFVRQKMFDQFRECILTNSKWENVLIPTKDIPPHIVQWLIKNACKHEHIVVLYVHISDIMAFSILYGKAWGLFRLGTGYLGVPFSSALVCDFETGKETIVDKILL